MIWMLQTIPLEEMQAKEIKALKLHNEKLGARVRSRRYSVIRGLMRVWLGGGA